MSSQDDSLDYSRFYDGFMAPFFGCDQCEQTKKAFALLEMDKGNVVDWNEFLLFLKWAFDEHQKDIGNVLDLLDVTFRKGIIPAIRDRQMTPEERNNIEHSEEPLPF